MVVVAPLEALLRLEREPACHHQAHGDEIILLLDGGEAPERGQQNGLIDSGRHLGRKPTRDQAHGPTLRTRKYTSADLRLGGPHPQDRIRLRRALALE